LQIVESSFSRLGSGYMGADVMQTKGCWSWRSMRQRALVGAVFGGVSLVWVSGLWGQGVRFSLAGGGPGQERIGISAVEPGQVVVEVVSQYKPVAVEGRFALAVVLNIPPGQHLYANPKQGQFGLDTEITPQPSRHFRFGKVIYPPGEKYEDKTLNASNHIYEGKTICYVPVEVGAFEAAELPVVAAVNLELKGLLCSDSDTGTCLGWQESVSIDIEIYQDKAAAGASDCPELFADFDPAAAWPSGAGDQAQPKSKEIAPDNWLTPILLALFAGVIMNLMPCVLPIIPIIVMTLMKQCAVEEGAQPDRRKSIKVGLAFAGGIMIVFCGLAVLMSVTKLLWGQQFQGNAFKFVLLMIVYVLSLSMFGLFEIVLPARVSNITIVRKGYLGALGMGMLATVLATPCGAPLLTPVLAWSLGKPLAVTIVVFLIIGAGMAVPYVLLTAFPRLLGRIPKGGNWMILLKHAIGFCMLAFCVYLIFLFSPVWHGPLFYFCLLLGFCVWLGLAVVNYATPTKKRLLVRTIALILLIAGSWALAVAVKTEGPAEAAENWLVQLENYQQQKRSVIVKFTANSCKSCAVLDKIIYKSQVFKDKLSETKTALVVADWSYGDADIARMLNELGGKALPFAVVFPGGEPDNPIILRDFYSMEDVINALDKAYERSR